MDPFRLCLALGPVAIYWLLLGAINMFRRPFLVSGGRDAAALGLAISGLLIVGPVELLFPVAAAVNFGTGTVWVCLIALYALCLVFTLLTLRPRLVVYNIPPDEFRPILADLAMELDSESRWAGDALLMPRLGVHLYLESAALMRNVSLKSAGPNQNHQGWWRLESVLETALGDVKVARNPCGLLIIAAGSLLSAALLAIVVYDPQGVTRSLAQLFGG
jgi:hypothetical protein